VSLAGHFWLRALTVLVLAVGLVAWVFPREVAAVAGAWLLPSLSILAIVLTMGRAFALWRILTVPVGGLAGMVLVAWNPASVTSTAHFAGVCFGLLAMVATAHEATAPGRLRLAVAGFLGAGTAMVVVGLAGAGTALARLGSVTPVVLPAQPLGLAGLPLGGDVNENALAAAALLVSPLGVAILMSRVGGGVQGLVLKVLAGSTVVGACVALASSHSRSAWLAVWLMIVGLLVYGVRSRMVRIVAGAALIAPVAGLLVLTLSMSQRAVQDSAVDAWASLHSRGPIMTQGWERWRESPWIGIGLNEFRAVYYPREQPVPHAHNIVLQTALDVGVVGSVAYWGLLAVLLGCARQAVTRNVPLAGSVAGGSAVALIASTLFGVVDAVPLGAKIGLFQWVASGLILAAWRIRASSPATSSS
jgi:putative inorganic carbon (HCO3(-)) transporter